MKNNELKEKVRKSVKEKIAILKIREEFDMKTNKSKKIIYCMLSSCAVIVLGVGIIIGINTLNNNQAKNNNYLISDLQKNNQNNNGESLEIDLNINKIKNMEKAKIDGDIEIIELENLSDELKFIKNISVPEKFKLTNSYKVYIRSDRNIIKYDLLHDYVFVYKKNDEKNILISVSTVKEPLRDYYLGDDNKISKIGNIELKISKYKEMYMATFKIEDIYFDIETSGIIESELVELLQSIINESKIATS